MIRCDMIWYGITRYNTIQCYTSRIVLYFALDLIGLYWIVLYDIVLYRIVQDWTKVDWIVLYWTVLYLNASDRSPLVVSIFNSTAFIMFLLNSFRNFSIRFVNLMLFLLASLAKEVMSRNYNIRRYRNQRADNPETRNFAIDEIEQRGFSLIGQHNVTVWFESTLFVSTGYASWRLELDQFRLQTSIHHLHLETLLCKKHYEISVGSNQSAYLWD